MIIGIPREVRVKGTDGLCRLSGQGLRCAQSHSHVVAVPPPRRAVREQLQRWCHIPRAQERIDQGRVDPRCARVNNEARAPGDHRLAVATRGGVTRAEVIHGRQKVRCRRDRSTKLLHGLFEVACGERRESDKKRRRVVIDAGAFDDGSRIGKPTRA